MTLQPFFLLVFSHLLKILDYSLLLSIGNIFSSGAASRQQLWRTSGGGAVRVTSGAAADRGEALLWRRTKPRVSLQKKRTMETSGCLIKVRSAPCTANVRGSRCGDQVARSAGDLFVVTSRMRCAGDQP